MIFRKEMLKSVFWGVISVLQVPEMQMDASAPTLSIAN